MSVQSVNGGSAYSNLQSVLEAARQRAKAAETIAAAKKTEPEPVRLPKAASGGAMFDRLYGAKKEEKQSDAVRVGSRFDVYA